MRIGFTFIALAIAALGSACNPSIGDGCNTSGDCSADGSRICDTNQPGGYCTILGCDPDTCPGEAACVEWRFEPSRTAETWCMLRCEGGCRGGYACAEPEQIPEDGFTPQGTGAETDFVPGDDGNAANPAQANPVARIIDIELGVEDTKICVAIRE